MKARGLIACAMALATAVEVAAQVAPSTRSDRRVQVSKGEVALSRVDTVYIVRTDTVFATRTERVPVRERVYVTRVDTVILTAPAIAPPVARAPMYAGFYMGPTMPSGNIDRRYTNGFHLGAMAGWEGPTQFIGFRLTSDISQLHRELGQSSSVLGTTTPLLWSFGGDLKVMPVREHGWQMYGIGGMNVYATKGIALVSERARDVPDGRGGFNRAVTDGNWHSAWGFNAGGGLDFRIGSQELFVEARAVAIQANEARTWFVPVSFGLRFF